MIGINLWVPNLIPQTEESEIEITARSALFIDSKIGNVLYPNVLGANYFVQVFTNRV